jgi:ABC-type transport system involved in multi-copper enzyme maturation permease subunit
MTGDVLTDGPRAPQDTTPAAGRGSRTWSLSWQGVRTVTRLELRQRVRSTRWVVVLGVWTALIGGLTTLVWLAVRPRDEFTMYGDSQGGAPSDDPAGRLMFGIIVFLVLSLGSLIAPALSATSINGDRAAGVLATLQTTLLSPAEIAVGKLLAAWATALALLLTSSPFILWAYLVGGTPAGRLLTTLALLATTLLVVCAVGLGWSAVAARTSSSAVLTYLTVAFLGLGLPLLFALTFPLVTTTELVSVRAPVESTSSAQAPVCEVRNERMQRTHTERTWWLLAPSPYVIVADAGPRPSGRDVGDDPLTGIRNSVREVRLGPPATEDWCSDVYNDPARRAARDSLSPVWPYGLAANVALAVGFVVLTVRRLRAPTRRLARGTRVA